MASLAAANAVPEMLTPMNPENVTILTFKSGSQGSGTEENVPKNRNAQGGYKESS